MSEGNKRKKKKKGTDDCGALDATRNNLGQNSDDMHFTRNL